MKKCFLFLVFSFVFFNAQTIDRYPDNQDFYKGGLGKFYKDVHQIILEKKLPVCENKNAYLFQKFLITESGEFKKVKDLSDDDIKFDECSINLLDQILPELKDWVPAQKNGENITAQSLFFFLPNDLGENYKDGYDPKKSYREAELAIGGLNSFRKDVARKVDISGFNGNGKVKVVISFVVDLDGSITNVKVDKSSGLKIFDDEFVQAVKSVKTKWTPAKINGTPVKQKFRIPFTVDF